MYAMCAMRHMHEFGTTSRAARLDQGRRLAPRAVQSARACCATWSRWRTCVDSPMIADPLHRLDCCVITDGGGALVVVQPEIARSLKRPLVKVHRRRRGAQAARSAATIDLTYSGARLVRRRRLRRGRRHAGRHQIRLDLRQLHHHRADADRGPRASARRARAAGSSPTAT